MSTRSTSAKVDRTVALRTLADDIGDWSAGGSPLYRLLSTAIARAIERGAVAQGSRLPSERTLAAALSISRGTAISAYDQLVAEGLVERRGGSGTFATDLGRLALPAGREGSALVARLVDRSAGSTDLIDLSISVLPDAQGLPAVGVTTADLLQVTPDTGYSPWGLPSLRATVARMLAGWGLPTQPEQVVITTGAQQAISIAAACWVRPDDLVVVDDPTYPGAVSAFAAAGATLLGVPLDRHGVELGPMQDALERRPALVYLQTSMHSPTGIVLSDARRRRLAEQLADARVPFVEDVSLAGLAWSRVPPPVAAEAPDQPIAVIGSLSKLLWGGLRLGFVRAPEPVALRFARVKATHDLGSSVVGQLLAERILASPEWPVTAAARNEALRTGCCLLTSLLRQRLPAWSWIEPSGGLSLWVQLPTPTARPFAEVALRHGVAVATADALSAAGGHDDRIRLCFALPETALARGVNRLAAAWNAHHR